MASCFISFAAVINVFDCTIGALEHLSVSNQLLHTALYYTIKSALKGNAAIQSAWLRAAGI